MPFRLELRTALTLGSLVLFVGLLFCYYSFVLDDAFIVYRFSQHLAEGQGLVWNLSGAPTEGYTSLLWVLIHAFGFFLGLEPVLVSKLLSAASALIIVGILAEGSRSTSWFLGAIVIGAVTWNPSFAFLTMQGLETTFTALLLLVVAVLSLTCVSQPSRRSTFLLFVVCFSSCLARPDCVPFIAGVLLGLGLISLKNRDEEQIARLGIATVFFSIASAIYMAWRISYFGHVFPNTSYVKLYQSDTFFTAAGIAYTQSFLLELLLPYLILFTLLSIRHSTRQQVVEVLPILLGGLLHIVYLTTLSPIQGFFWRFAIPIYPALLLTGVRVLRDHQVQNRKVVHIAILCFFFVWQLRLFPVTLDQKRLRTQNDRVAAGQALEGLDGVMLTSAAGALPYYSGWRAVDVLGLTSEEISRQGLSLPILYQLNPDLIALRSPEPNRFVLRNRRKILEKYILEESFTAIAALHRSDGYYMYYFARQGSPLFIELVDRLQTIEGVTYGDLTKLLEESQIPTVSARP